LSEEQRDRHCGAIDISNAIPAGMQADEVDPVRPGLAIIELQRASSHPTGERNVAMRNMSGFAQLTTIVRGSIKTRVIHRWSDRGAKLASDVSV
jgi:hypothetical protein